MSQKDHFNRGGMLLFGISFVFTIAFFVYVMVINPGPLDTGVFDVPVRFSKAQADERTSEWKNITPERISLGEQLYMVNCQSCHAQAGTDQVLARFSSGQPKLGATPLQVYASIRKGFDGQHRMDYFPEESKWAMIAYLRSRSQNPPEDSTSDWKRFLSEGLY